MNQTELILQKELEQLRQTQNYRTLPCVKHQGHNIVKDGHSMLNLSSNDYLGLATDTHLRQEFLDQLDAESFLPGSSSSRLLTGNFAIYDKLEQKLAELFGTEAALTFNSGYHANIGILPAIAHSQTLIISDKLVHASLIDGIRLSQAVHLRYRHNDYSQLEKILQKHADRYERIIIVTESIFSMDGDEADLPLLIRLKKQFGALLYVDEAHAFGVRGLTGLGCAEAAGCIKEIDFLVGTFGKSLASTGAFIVCSQVIREYLINRMRSFIFTTALPPAAIQWTLFLLERLPSMNERRIGLASVSKQFRTAIQAATGDCPSSSHIVPLMIGESSKAIACSEYLQRNGFYALPVRPPSVPEKTARIRFSLTADIQEQDITDLIQLVNQQANVQLK